MDCSLPGSSLHGILQARVLKWVVISFSRGSFRLRDWTWVSCIPGRCFNLWATREALFNIIYTYKTFIGRESVIFKTTDDKTKRYLHQFFFRDSGLIDFRCYLGISICQSCPGESNVLCWMVSFFTARHMLLHSWLQIVLKSVLCGQCVLSQSGLQKCWCNS